MYVDKIRIPALKKRLNLSFDASETSRGIKDRQNGSYFLDKTIFAKRNISREKQEANRSRGGPEGRRIEPDVAARAELSIPLTYPRGLIQPDVSRLETFNRCLIEHHDRI